MRLVLKQTLCTIAGYRASETTLRLENMNGTTALRKQLSNNAPQPTIQVNGNSKALSSDSNGSAGTVQAAAAMAGMATISNGGLQIHNHGTDKYLVNVQNQTLQITPKHTPPLTPLSTSSLQLPARLSTLPSHDPCSPVGSDTSFANGQITPETDEAFFSGQSTCSLSDYGAAPPPGNRYSGEAKRLATADNAIHANGVSNGRPRANTLAALSIQVSASVLRFHFAQSSRQ